MGPVERTMKGEVERASSGWTPCCGFRRLILEGWAAVSLCSVVLLVVIATPRPAVAEHCDRTQRSEAAQHKQKGWQVRDEDPEAAAKAFKSAYEACPDPWYLGHLALLYEKMGRIREAIEFVDAYLDHGSSAQRDQALKGRDRLRALLGRVRIRTEPPGADLLIDGEEFEDAPFTPAMVELDPGDHLIEFRLEEYRRARREISVESGQEHRVKVSLQSLSEEPVEFQDRREPDPEPEEERRWTFSLQVGAGVTFPLGTEMIGTAFSIPFDIAGGYDFGGVRLELLAQVFLFPDTNGLIVQVGGGLRVGIRLGERPLYLGIEMVLGLSQVNVNTPGRRIPMGKYSSLGFEPALFFSWNVIERLEIVARALRLEVMGLTGDLPGGTAVRWGLDVGVRVRF